MKLIPSIAAALLFSISTAIAGPTLVSVTQDSGAKTFAPTDILQIVGAVGGPPATGRPVLRITYEGGMVVNNYIGLQTIATGESRSYESYSNTLLGQTLLGVTSMEVINNPGAVTVKILSQAAEFVSEPAILPMVDDGTYAVSLETSVDMQNWAPAFPGDYLGSTSHRFFRVKAIKKDGPAPAVPAAAK